MKVLELDNPFDAPVYYEETVSSTMDVLRLLAEQGEPHGTVILADFQESGRGRSNLRPELCYQGPDGPRVSFGNRPWISGKGQNLMFSILLRYSGFTALPQALTLKAGLAIALALEAIFPALAGYIKVKWPNDIMIHTGETARKAAGMLAEAESSSGNSLVYLGAGINLFQREFPEELQDKAVSIASALETLGAPSAMPAGIPARPLDVRNVLLQKIISLLFFELEGIGPESWKIRLEERLYKRGEEVSFAEGAADSGKVVHGRLEGIGAAGELLLIPHGEKAPRPFLTGELRVYLQ